MSQERRLTFEGRRTGAYFKSGSNMLLEECSNTELRRAIQGSVEICRLLYGYVGLMQDLQSAAQPCMVVHSRKQPLLNNPTEQYIDYEQSSFFSWSVEQNARDTQITTRVTEGARRERHFFLLGLPPSFLASRGFAAERSRARALPFLNLKIKRNSSHSKR